MMFELAKTYGKVKEVIEKFVLCLLSDANNMMSIQRLNTMDQTRKVSSYPNITFPTFPIITNHHTVINKSFNIEHISHYLRIIMFGSYNNPTKSVLASIASGTAALED
jgi:hypothetical protein